jgi:hypothetical protein
MITESPHLPGSGQRRSPHSTTAARVLGEGMLQFSLKESKGETGRVGAGWEKGEGTNPGDPGIPGLWRMGLPGIS